MENKDFFVKVSGLFNKKKRGSRRALVWITMLFVFVFVNMVISSLAVYWFTQSYKEDGFGLNYESSKEGFAMKVDKELLMNVINVFDAKAEDFERLKMIPSKIIDPSI